MMDDVGRYCWGAAAVLALAFLGMIFSAAEAAVAACSESRLRRQSEEGDSRAGLLLEAKERQAAFSLWAQVSASVCLLSADVFGTVFFAPALLPWLESWIPNPVWAKWVSWGGVFLLLSFLLLVLGVALPKKLSLYAPDKTAFGMQGAVKILSRIFCPLTWLILKTTRLLLRLLGKNPDQETDEITEEEIRMMVDAGKEQGAIELSEREMINNIFEFDDRTVGEVMTHRTDISAVSRSAPLSEVLALVLEEGFSRIPVYDSDMDDIVGLVYAKDLLSLVGEEPADGKTAGDYLRTVIYTPESTRCRMLFRQFKEQKVHMAVIVDEYGGTAGIATMEDLIESVMGNIQDEYDQEEDEVLPLEEGGYSFDGGVQLELVERLLETDLEADEDTDTLGGLIANTLGRIPGDGENPSVTIAGVEFTVLLAEDRRIMRVQARRVPLPADEPVEEES